MTLKLVMATGVKTAFIIMQVRYPDRITLIRGNHESRQITQVTLAAFASCETLGVLSAVTVNMLKL